MKTRFRATRCTTFQQRKSIVLTISFFTFLFITWFLLSIKYPPFIMPPPLEVLRALIKILTSGDMLVHTKMTLYRVIVGFFIALILSLLLSFIMSYIKSLQTLLHRLVIFIQSIPSAIWIILAILWFGISDLSPIFVIAAIIFPIITLNIFEGVKNVNKELIQMAKIFNHTYPSIFTKIVIPSMFPYILAGCRIGMNTAWKISVIAEVLGAGSGIGYAIVSSLETLKTERIFAWAIVLVVILQSIEMGVFTTLEKRAMRYKMQ